MEGGKWKTPAWAKAASTNYSFRRGRKVQMPGTPLGCTLGLQKQGPATPQDTPARPIEEQEECRNMDTLSGRIETCYGFTQERRIPLNDPGLASYDSGLEFRLELIRKTAMREINWIDDFAKEIVPCLKFYDKATMETLQAFSDEKLKEDSLKISRGIACVKGGVQNLAKLLEDTDSCFLIDEILPAIKSGYTLVQVAENVHSKILLARRSIKR